VLNGGKDLVYVKNVFLDDNDFNEELIDIRRQIHRHPELAFEERKTSRLIAEYLKKLGLEYMKVLDARV